MKKTLLGVVVGVLLWGVAFAVDDHYCHGDSVTLELAITDSTFWTVSNPDSIKLYWGTFSGGATPDIADSAILGSGNWTNWRINAGYAGFFVYKIAASVDGVDSAYSCWAAAYVLDGGVSGPKTWTWFVGNCKEDSIRADIVTAQAYLDTLLDESRALEEELLFPFEKPGVLIESFDDTTDFTKAGSGTNYWVLNKKGVLVREGAGSLKLIATGVESCYVYRSHGGASTNGTLKFRDIETISFWVYVDVPSSDNKNEAGNWSGDWDNDFDHVQLRLTDEAGAPGTWTNWYFVDLYDSTLTAGWQHIILHRSQLAVNGSMVLTDTLGSISFTVKSDSTGDSIGIVFDDLRFNEKNTPTIVYNFDDGHATICTLGYAFLHDSLSPPINADVMLSAAEIDNPASLTYSHLRTMHEGGWDISNHSTSHPNFGQSVVSTVRDEALYCARQIEDTLTEGAFNKEVNPSEWIGAYPGGSYDQDAIDVLRHAGFSLWRTALFGRQHQGHLEYPGGDEWFRIKSGYLNSTYGEDSTSMMASVDTCILRGGFLTLMYHSLRTASPPVGHQFDTVQFNAVARYVDAKRDSGLCEVMTFTEYIQKMRTSRHFELRNYKVLKEIAGYIGACPGCYTRLFPQDATQGKDSVYVIDPRLGADSLWIKLYFQEYGAEYYDTSGVVYPTKESQKEFVK